MSHAYTGRMFEAAGTAAQRPEAGLCLGRGGLWSERGKQAWGRATGGTLGVDFASQRNRSHVRILSSGVTRYGFLSKRGASWWLSW